MATTRTIDLNADMGESYGPWRMGDDAALLGIITSASIACGGHASDPGTMYATLSLARQRGVVAGAHPGYADREGFGRRVIPMSGAEIEQLVATQIGALMGAAALAGTTIRYVKPHGALGNVAAEDRGVADAIVRATKAVSPDLALLAMSGSALEASGEAAGLAVFCEIFADRAYLPNGQLVPRAREGAMIHDPDVAAQRLVDFIETGRMATIDGQAIALKAHSICMHGDSAGALAMARHVRRALEERGITIRAFLGAE